MSSKMKATATKGEARPALVPKLRFPEFRKSEGWDADALGDVANFVNEKVSLERVALENYVSTENILPDYGGVAKSSKLPSTGSVTRYRPNDTLVSNIRPYLKKVWVADKEGGASNDVIVIRAKERLLPQYFSCLLKNDAFIDYVMTGAKGVKMPRGDIGSMKAYPTLYPSPPEQQKIAECLSSVDELIAAQARKVDALKTHKKGLMQQLFPREGETQPRIRFPEFQNAGEWDVTTIGDLKPFVTSGSRGWAQFYAEKGELFVRITNLWRSSIYLDLTDSKFVQLPPGANEGVRTQLKEHDVLISITADIGIIGYVDEAVPSPAYINQHIALVRFDAGQLCAKYIAYFLASEKSQRLFRASTDTGTKAGMSLIGIQKIELMLPGLHEQQRIADCLTSLDELIAAQTQKHEALKTHKKGLMQQLFPSPEQQNTL
jgi:type I restriction enzyme S subunit